MRSSHLFPVCRPRIWRGFWAYCSSRRLCCATHVLEAAETFVRFRGLLGHKDVRTTRCYNPALNRGDCGVQGPRDRLLNGASDLC